MLSDFAILRKFELFWIINGQPAREVLAKPNVRPRIRRIVDQRQQRGVQLGEFVRRLLVVEAY